MISSYPSIKKLITSTENAIPLSWINIIQALNIILVLTLFTFSFKWCLQNFLFTLNGKYLLYIFEAILIISIVLQRWAWSWKNLRIIDMYRYMCWNCFRLWRNNTVPIKIRCAHFRASAHAHALLPFSIYRNGKKKPFPFQSLNT